MYSYIEGKLVEKNPTFVVIEAQGIGYLINISLNTFGLIPDSEKCRLYIHQVIREDAHLFYGFYNTDERDLFRHLISVSGIGANTARLILSALQPEDIQEAIATGNYNILQTVKGVGAKTAQRLVVDLKDKVFKGEKGSGKLNLIHNTKKEEALSGLLSLGFAKNVAGKAIDKVVQNDGNELSVEEIIKNSLKIL